MYLRLGGEQNTEYQSSLWMPSASEARQFVMTCRHWSIAIALSLHDCNSLVIILFAIRTLFSTLPFDWGYLGDWEYLGDDVV